MAWPSTAVSYARLGRSVLCDAGYGVYALDQRGHGKTGERGTLGHFAERRWLERGSRAIWPASTSTSASSIRGCRSFCWATAWAAISPRLICCTTAPACRGRFSAARISSPWPCTAPRGLIARMPNACARASARAQCADRVAVVRLVQQSVQTQPHGISTGSAVTRTKSTRYATTRLCGFRCTNQLWIDLLGGLQQISKASNLAQIDPGLPILVIGGECDPVSEGKRLERPGPCPA